MDIFREGKWYKQPYTDANIFASVQFWLIKLIAGKSAVMLNVGLKVEDSMGDRFPVSVEDMDGLCAYNVKFDIPDGKKLTLTQATKEESPD